MPGSITLSLGGYSIIFAITFLLLGVILFSIFVYRQIRRLRTNSARKPINSTVAVELSKKSRQSITKKIDAVFSFRATHFPKFTDCMLISKHSNTPHLHRMIAFDEVLRDVDRQLEFINPELIRNSGESTYCFLNRIRNMNIIPELTDEFVERLGFLHEWSRYRTHPPFQAEQLEEIRTMLKEFVRLLNKNQNALTSLNFKSKNRSLETKPNNLGFRISTAKTSSLPERATFEQIPLLYAQNDTTPSDSPRHSRHRSPPKMNQTTTPGSALEGPSSYMKNGRKSLRPFAEDTRLSSAVLPAPPSQKHNGTQKFDSIDGTQRLDATHVNQTVNPLPELMRKRVQPNSTTTTTPISTTTEDAADLGDVFGSVWKKVKQVMGFSPPCYNNGHKNLRGLCECPRYYEGEQCESIICLNNGTRTKIRSMVPQQDVCKCPHPNYITGQHCQYIHCQNGGVDTGNGSCKCNSDFYTGQFCESYASSWVAVLGVPLICLAIIVICCIFCRLDICPRRSTRRRHSERRRHHGNYQIPSRRSYANHHNRYAPNIISETVSDQARMLQENLLNDAAARRQATERTSSSANRSSLLVYRLEAVPAFNPEAFANVDYKSLEGPPPYEEAIMSRYVPINPPTSSNDHNLPQYSPPRVTTNQQQLSRSHRNNDVG
ncbi:EGF-like domain-containing protein [Aphelenchoides besseyi]|nr:EGF-like domain-containing protein [Aphelenchoides besseyi]KAI6208144.1 EGF-like domain-containing protein [Aphelenchoides besseyi]